MFHLNILKKNLLQVLFFWKIRKKMWFGDFPFLFSTLLLCYIVNVAIIIIIIVFFFHVYNGMLCTKHIIVFCLENSFSIVLSGEV